MLPGLFRRHRQPLINEQRWADSSIVTPWWGRFKEDPVVGRHYRYRWILCFPDMKEAHLFPLFLQISDKHTAFNEVCMYVCFGGGVVGRMRCAGPLQRWISIRNVFAFLYLILYLRCTIETLKSFLWFTSYIGWAWNGVLLETPHTSLIIKALVGPQCP